MSAGAVVAAPGAIASDTVEVRRLSPAETAAYLDATPEAVVVDVRTPAEVAASGRLAGALVLDVNAPDFEARAQAALDVDRPMVLYCRSGARAGQAAQRLARLGFSRLFNAGGFDALAAVGLATEPPSHD
ncbi:rhodanese-like domain-containing protein [Rubrivirga sp. SAORIC476]|uniref:rhodanese-like domain-containing protein n=1 Tax=Rubrivirga sp. SAORIC476 TaxID=1961794 RepID=UPI0035102625